MNFETRCHNDTLQEEKKKANFLKNKIITYILFWHVTDDVTRHVDQGYAH